MTISQEIPNGATSGATNGHVANGNGVAESTKHVSSANLFNLSDRTIIGKLKFIVLL